MKKIIFLIVISLIGSTSYANEPIKLPDIIIKALEAYKKSGSDAYIPNLLKNGPLENDKTALSQSNTIRQIEELYGELIDYEPSRVLKLGDSTSIYYYILKHKKGPVYANATIYKVDGDEIVTRFFLHTNEQKIYHQAMLK